jgi:hypothetical protein
MDEPALEACGGSRIAQTLRDLDNELLGDGKLSIQARNYGCRGGELLLKFADAIAGSWSESTKAFRENESERLGRCPL